MASERVRRGGVSRVGGRRGAVWAGGAMDAVCTKRGKTKWIMSRT